jgi:hypothetical protein
VKREARDIFPPTTGTCPTYQPGVWRLETAQATLANRGRQAKPTYDYVPLHRTQGTLLYVSIDASNTTDYCCWPIAAYSAAMAKRLYSKRDARRCDLARSKRCCPSPFLDPLIPIPSDMNRVRDRNRLLVPPEPVLELCFDQPSPRPHSSLSRLCMRCFFLTVLLGHLRPAAAQDSYASHFSSRYQPLSTKAAL